MVNVFNANVALSLWGGSSSSTMGISADLLASWAAAKTGNTSTAATLSAGQDPNAPVAQVWQPGYTPSDALLVQSATTGKAFFDVNTPLYSDLGATGDYKKLFALYTGIESLNALAKAAGTDGITKPQTALVQKSFTRGLSELASFFQTQSFDDVRLIQGDRVDSEQTTLAIPPTSEDYTTPVIQRGSVSAVLSGLDPNASFNISAQTLGGTQKTVAINLSEMNSLPRSLANIVSFVNNKLSAAGVSSRLATVDQTPKTQNMFIGGQIVAKPYTGQKQYALKVDVRAGESIQFAPTNPDPAFYVVGANPAGGRLVKLADVSDMPGQTQFLDRPAATADPTGANVETGWMGPGEPYQSAPAGAAEQKTVALVSAGDNTYEDKLRAAGEANLQLTLADGRKISVSTAWRDGDLETWRTRSGETSDQGVMGDLAQRLTQLLHEQGVAAGVDVWNDGADSGLTIKTGDFVSVSGLTISGSNVATTPVAPPSGDYVGGLRGGVYARQFEVADVADTGDLYKGAQSFAFTTAKGANTITINGGTDGIDAASLVSQLNDKLLSNNIPAAASLVDINGKMTLHIDAMHEVTGVLATINGAANTLALVAPDSGVVGGLPVSSPGQPFADGVRTSTASASPLLTNTGALNISVVVATPQGNKTVSVAVSAAERASDPDPAPGQWSQTFQDRLNTALNAAGVYVGATSNDLTQWSVGESAGDRLASVTVNGQALSLTSGDPGGIGGAFGAERSFTSGQAASGVSDDIPALASNPNVSISFDTVWGTKTVSASLQPGDPQTLQSVAMRLNEQLKTQGYDLGVATTDLAGGGSGLRIVAGDTHSVRTVEGLSVGGSSVSVSLDPIDSQSHADDPSGAAGVASRADRAASATLTTPTTSYLAAPTANSTAWFAGRAFDVALDGGSKVANARAVATAPDGSVYVLADLSGDSTTTPIKGASDIALLKYDSAGKMMFSRILGASDQASGFALSVSSDGKVAVAGSVTGGLSGAQGASSGTDSLVAVFDSSGIEQWASRRGATGNDQAQAVAFAPDGSVIVTGKTDTALSGNVALGRSDAYVRGFSKGGLEAFSKEFGTSGDDTATALSVRDNGAGGIDIVTGGVENNRGVLRSFSYSSSTGLSTGAVRDIGNFAGGAVSSLVADGSSLYVGGTVGGERVSVGDVVREAVAGKEGFVAKLDIGLSSTSLDRTTYIGSSGDDSVTGLALVNGEVYATGAAGGVIAGQGKAGAASAFIARLSDTGDIGWARTFSTAGGTIAPTGIAVDMHGASSGLDILGLPRGAIGAADTSALTSRSSLRVGDEFKIGVDENHILTISIGAKETMSSLLVKINHAIGSAGRAQLVTDASGQRIKLTAADGHALRIQAGRAGHDGLGGLGLTEGVIATKPTSKTALRTFGLGLNDSELKLDNASNITKSKAILSAAASIIRQAYEAIADPNAKELTDAEKALQARKQAASSSSTAVYTAQIANYQAALARLSGN